MTFFHLSFARLNTVTMEVREQCKAESDFLLILLSQGYISTAGSPLNFPLGVAPQPAEVWAVSLCIFNFSVRWNRCKRPLENCEGRECCAEHSLFCCSVKEVVHWHTPERSGKQTASSHSFRSNRHMDNIHHPIAKAELCWPGAVFSGCRCFLSVVSCVVIAVHPHIQYNSDLV